MAQNEVVLDGELSLDVQMDGEFGIITKVGSEPNIEPLQVTENGIYTAGNGVDGYNPVIVNTGIDALRSEIDSAVEVSGCDPLVEGLTALTTYANEVTGESNTNLSDAIGSLVAGYGGGNSIFTIEKIKTYTVDESWENDTKGNPVAIQNALGINIDELTNYLESFLCIFRNNNATNASYRVDLIQYTKDSSIYRYGSYSLRGNFSTVRNVSATNTSLWASVGTIIDVYKVKINL